MKLSITLCGKPKPQLTWRVDGLVVNGTISRDEIRKHQYTYHVIFPGTVDVCGKFISYTAIGYLGRNVTGASYILPKPRKSFTKIDSVLRVNLENPVGFS